MEFDRFFLTNKLVRKEAEVGGALAKRALAIVAEESPGVGKTS